MRSKHLLNNDKYFFELLNNHINYYSKIVKIKKKLNCGKIVRQINFPEFISEYIAKSCYSTFYKKNVEFANSGDLISDNKKIEVKAFTSLGPSSFGPKESWNELMFVDARKFYKRQFKIYLIKLSNNDNKWKNIKINLNETYQEQCDKGRRPRIKFDNLCEQLSDEIEIVFNGSIILKNNKLKFNNL